MRRQAARLVGFSKEFSKELLRDVIQAEHR